MHPSVMPRMVGTPLLQRRFKVKLPGRRPLECTATTAAPRACLRCAESSRCRVDHGYWPHEAAADRCHGGRACREPRRSAPRLDCCYSSAGRSDEAPQTGSSGVSGSACRDAGPAPGSGGWVRSASTRAATLSGCSHFRWEAARPGSLLAGGKASDHGKHPELISIQT
jgi:hypothetical protein